jgi:CheY-like chemotaxis protein
MPELDGIEASRAIRNLDHPARNLPIVAITANAFRSDELACLAAGMDGFISKPISPDRLSAVINRFLAGTLRPENMALQAPSANQPGIDPELQRDVLDAFLDEAAEHIARARLSFGTARFRDALQELRELQDVAATIGMDEVASACGDAIAMVDFVDHAVAGDFYQKLEAIVSITIQMDDGVNPPFSGA